MVEGLPAKAGTVDAQEDEHHGEQMCGDELPVELERRDGPGATDLVARPYRFYYRRMMEAIAFDTHRFVKRLTESGFTEKQAETLADEHVSLLNGNLATKADVAKVEARIEAVKADLLKWMFGALIAQGGLIVALVKLL